jgi:hypothetical protein
MQRSLSGRGKKEIDEVATSISENLKGWIVVVEGYADSTCGTVSTKFFVKSRCALGGHSCRRSTRVNAD